MFVVSKMAKYMFGSRNQRAIKRMFKIVERINRLEPDYEKLDASSIQAKTDELKQRVKEGENLDAIIVEAFALVREASKRTLKQRHFDVQLIGGMVIHQGKIAEMCTGEGKTLMSTLAVYLNALSGKGVHVVTVNDYLAKRDAEWMRPIYEMLGLTVGVNLPHMSQVEKRAAYAADVTYGTNNEFGFDYLRDNMVFKLEDRVQRGLHYAIVDEVDSILIDEARTPLIISGPAEDTSEFYAKVNVLIPKLKKCADEKSEGDYHLDEKRKQAHLTEAGHQHVEKLMAQAGLIKGNSSLYDSTNIILMHHLNAALRAHALYQRDVDYIVSDGEVVIVDEHTGRTMPGRRWSDGLHQAVEAKEGVSIRNENQTLATITFQNYFRMYEKLSGMTGTADTEAYELQQIYGLEVLVIPTNLPLIRKDHSDKVYLTAKEKFKAVASEVKTCMLRGQPVLLGSASIETSEELSDILKAADIPHQVLNAKQHAKEAKIIAQAGRPGAVTIATNMAGRGTDIVLGGSLEAELAELDTPTPEEVEAIKQAWQKRHDAVIAAGGLHVLGSERHASRRIDNQLRGRAGRQGDPGSSRFYVSFEDDLMRIFAAERTANLMRRFGMKEEDAIEHTLVSKVIANAQRKVESYHFDVRKQLLEFDDVANEQRKVIYQQRTELLEGIDISGTVNVVRQDVVDYLIGKYAKATQLEEQWNLDELQTVLKNDFGLLVSLREWLDNDETMDSEGINALILEKLKEVYAAKEALVGSDVMRQFEKNVMIETLDQHWKEHLATMDYLRQSVHLSGYAQKNPKQEYKKEAFWLFTRLLDSLKYEVIKLLSLVEIQAPDEVDALEEQRRQKIESQQMVYQHEDITGADADESNETADSKKCAVSRRREPKIGRNAVCPCGSGKKYKRCCGRLANQVMSGGGMNDDNRESRV
jgi:preprotein translocase subunit SecA